MRKSPLLPIFLIVAVDILGLTIMIPLLPFYAEHFGASPFVVGMLISSYAFCQLISGPVLGKWSDTTGRKPLLILSQVGTLIGFLMLAFSQTLWMVFVARIIDGLTAGNLSLAQAYISDVTKPEDRAKSFAIIGISFGLGFLIGPAISGFLSQYGIQYPIFAASGLSALSIVATTFLLPRSVPHETDGSAQSAPGGKRLSIFNWAAYAEFFKRPELSGLLLQFFCFALYFSLFISGFALFSERRFTLFDGTPWGTKQVGYVYAYVGFLGIILQGGMMGRLVKKYGETKLVHVGFLSAMIGYFVIAFVFHLPGLLIAATIGSVGNGVLRPSITSLVTKFASRREQGVVLGLTQSLNSLATIICPLISGFLIQNSYLMIWAFLVATIAFVGFLLSLKDKPAPAQVLA